VIRAVGFDLGETLTYYPGVPLNWQPLYRPALTAMAQACDVTATNPMLDVGEFTLARYNTRLYPRREEVSFRQIMASIFAAWGVPSPTNADAAEEAFFGFFQHQVAVYDDVLPALQDLRRRDMAAGLLTDVPYGMGGRFVARDIAPFAEHLDVWFTSVFVEVRKPDPEGFETLMSALDVWRDEMIYVGNEEKNVVGANRAGLRSVLIDREGTGRSYGQWRTICSLSELAGLL